MTDRVRRGPRAVLLNVTANEPAEKVPAASAPTASEPTANASTVHDPPAALKTARDAYDAITDAYKRPSATFRLKSRRYRWSAKDLDEVMMRFGGADTLAVIRTAVALGAGDKYLSRDELAAAARKNTEYMTTRYDWSPTTLEQVMNEHGLHEEMALVKTAIQLDDGDKHLSRSELESAAEVLRGALSPNDVQGLFQRIDAARAQPFVHVEELGRVEGVPVNALRFASTEQPPKVRVLVSGGVHGNEPCGTGAAALLIEQLLKDPRLRQDVEFTVVPLVNPRGMMLGTRRTPENGDLNRLANEDPHAPGEIQALGGMLRREQPFDVAIDLHGGKAKRDGFFALHHGARELLEPALHRFAQRWPVLHRNSKPYDMPEPGIGQSSHQNTVKDFFATHGVKASLTLEAPGSVSYLDQVLGENELVHDIVNEARLRAAA